MGTIDRVGTFLGTITESALSITKANSYPQSVLRLLADKFYVTSEADLAHYGMTEPGYVDWNFDESIVGYLVLFNDKGPLHSYDQLIAATGWDGQDFQTLSDLVGKHVLFRVEEDTYNNVTSMKVKWIDKDTAPPERTLKTVDADQAKALTKQFLSGLKKPVAPAKPTAAKAATPPAKAVVAPSPATAPAAVTSAAAPAAAAAAPSTPSTPSTQQKVVAPKKPKTPPPPPADTAPVGLPTTTTKAEAWEYINDPANKGQNDDTVIADAWIAAVAEVGESLPEEQFTGEHWAKIRNTVLKDLGVKV
jgi:hypothetical protein